MVKHWRAMLVIGGLVTNTNTFNLNASPCRRRRRRRREAKVSLDVSSTSIPSDSTVDDRTPDGNKKTAASARRNIAVLVSDDPSDEEAVNRLHRVAEELDLHIVRSPDGGDVSSYTQYLTTTPIHTNSYAIAIRSAQASKRKGRVKLETPVLVDFLPPPDSKLGYRLRNDAGGGMEMLVKALGIKKIIPEKEASGENLVVYDLTAGLARDSIVIISSVLSTMSTKNSISSFRLLMVERDPIVAVLLKDAIRRFGEMDDEYTRQLQSCLEIQEGESIDVLRALREESCDRRQVAYPPDIIYLDPMFPPRKKRASAVKKDLAMLHALLGTAEATGSSSSRIKGERALLLSAIEAATKRVVCKRPVAAPPLGIEDGENKDSEIPIPSFEIKGSTNRFDVYVIS